VERALAPEPEALEQPDRPLVGRVRVGFHAAPPERERLVLRGIVADDAADLFAFRSDPVEQRYNDPPLRTLDEAHDLIARLDRERREFDALHWGITLAGDDRVVGLLGYNEVVAEHRRASLGYDIARRLWGRGLATEALTAVLDHGFGRHQHRRHGEPR
jgi:RimJ/RimL family protein N-acetyltransferase